MKKPHLIIIMADQLREDAVGAGYTPNIDALAADGVRFSHAYCNSPLCVPSRGSFFTGTYPNTNGSLINPWEPHDAHYGDVREGIDNLYTLMENHWESLHSGKQHLYTQGGRLQERADSPTLFLSDEASYAAHLKEHGQPRPGGTAFRTKVPEMVNGLATRISSYSTAATGRYEPGLAHYFDGYFTDKAIEGLRARDPSRPLLLNAMLLAPHPPFMIPEPWYSKVREEDVRLPDNVGVYDWYQSPLQMYNLPGIVGTRYDREHWKETWRVYLGLVSLLDDCVGRIVDELKAQNIYDDSLIVFTADHGEMLGSHALFQKMCMYEESTRVPLFMKFPKDTVLKRSSVDEEVSLIDVLPTICDYLDLRPRHRMDGQSLLPLLQEEQEGAARDILIQYDGNGSRSNFQRCIVRRRTKLIVDMFKDEVYYELYDLKEDSEERINLLFQPGHDDLAIELEAALSRHMQETGDMLSLPPFRPADFRSKYAPFPAK